MKKITADSTEAQSADIVNENIEQLKKLFPDAFTEDGINFESLRQLLGDEGVLDEGEEKYGLNWHGKKQARQIALTPSTGTLLPCPEESVDWDTTQNLFIEGDNLEVLKLLQKSYTGKVKMIYIDPPYNTGNEFIYPDKFQDNLDTYLKYTGQVDDEGMKFSSNTETLGKKHTNWLNMMYPRLKLARGLLKKDGVLFISIDDNEGYNLKNICDEILGEDNFMTTVAVKLSESTGVKMSHANKRIPKLKEYILVYRKNSQPEIIPSMIDKEKWDSEYKTVCTNISEEELVTIKEVLSNGNRAPRDEEIVEELLSKIEFKPANSVCKDETGDNLNEAWCFNNAYRIVQLVSVTGSARTLAKDKKKSFVENDLPGAFSIITSTQKMYAIKADFNENSNIPRCKILFADQYLQVNTGDFWGDIKTTGLDNEGYVDFKNGKKPLKMIKRCLNLTVPSDGLVLDFFAGSATTAHATMQLNVEDNSNRKFIMVQLPETTDKKSEAYKSGYSTISEIGKERIRLASQKIKEDNPDYQGDLGFKVFKLASSNIKAWNPDRTDLEQSLLDHQDHLISGRTEQDVLYELLLKRGVDLTAPIEEREFNNKIVYSIGYGALFACLDESIESADVTEIAQGIITWYKELEPASDTHVFFRDSAFADDEVKTNMVLMLEQNGLSHVRSL